MCKMVSGRLVGTLAVSVALFLAACSSDDAASSDFSEQSQPGLDQPGHDEPVSDSSATKNEPAVDSVSSDSVSTGLDVEEACKNFSISLCYVRLNDEENPPYLIYTKDSNWAELKCGEENDGQKVDYEWSDKYTYITYHFKCSAGEWHKISTLENHCPEPSVGDFCTFLTGTYYFQSFGNYVYTSAGWIELGNLFCFPLPIDYINSQGSRSSQVYNFRYYSTVILDSDTDSPIIIKRVCRDEGSWRIGEDSVLVNFEKDRIEIKSNGEIDGGRTYSSSLKMAKPEEECSASNEGEYKTVLDTLWIYTNNDAYVRELYYHCESNEWVELPCHAPAEACTESNLDDNALVYCVPSDGNIIYARTGKFICKEDGWQYVGSDDPVD